MKKILASAGLVALGAASLQAATTPTLPSSSSGRSWNVSASLRGFYDDNYATAPDVVKRDSFGFEISPMASVILGLGGPTQFGASYKYGLRYYEDRTNNRADHSHQFNLNFNHEFSPRYRVSLYDDLVVAQEGFLLDPAQRVQALRLNGNNVRNIAGVDFVADMSDNIAIEPGYSFTFYDYDGKGPASYSARLDRQEHLAKLAVRWKRMLERTDGLLGYQFGSVNYTSEDTLDPTNVPLSPKLRNNRSHYYFAGVDYTATAQLTLNLRAGAQTVDYRGGRATHTSPYVDFSGTYRFQPASTLQLGYKLSRISTDLIGRVAADPANITIDQLAHFLYGRVSHTISRLTLSAGAQYQYGTFRGGAIQSQSEDYLMVDVSANYRFNEFLSAEVGYMAELLRDHGWQTTGVGVRNFDRNMVYIGIKATY
jgi:hypothetical protein